MSFDEKGVSARLKKELKKSRFDHVRGVVKTARALASRHGVDPGRAAQAAWLHDCAKGMERESMEPLLRAAGADREERLLPALWHAPIGALLARRDYGVRDPEVLEAIQFHSTGAPGQTPLQKVLFVADYIEPGRPAWPELPGLRRLARTDLDAAWAQVLGFKLNDLIRRRRPLHSRSIAAYHYSLLKS